MLHILIIGILLGATLGFLIREIGAQKEMKRFKAIINQERLHRDLLTKENLTLLSKIPHLDIARSIKLRNTESSTAFNLKRIDPEYDKLIAVYHNGNPYVEYTQLLNTTACVYQIGEFTFVYSVKTKEDKDEK